MSGVGSTEMIHAPIAERSVWRDVVHSSGANVFAAVVSVAILIVTARALGPSGRGMYAAATSWVLMFSSLGSLSLGQVITHHTANKPRTEWVDETVGTLRALIAVITVVCWTTCFTVFAMSAGRPFGQVPGSMLAIVMAGLPFILWYDNGRYVLFALDAVPTFNWSQFAGYSLSLLAVVVALDVFDLGLRGAFAGWLLLYASMAAIGYRRIRAAARRPAFRWSAAKRFLRDSARLHLSTIGTFVHLQSTVLILNYYRPPREAGYYQLATQILALGTLIPMGMSSVSYSIVAQRGPDGAWPVHRRLVVQALVFAIVAMAVGYALMPIVVTLVGGEDFAPSIPLARVLLASLMGMALSIVMASQWIGRGLFWQTATVSSVVAIMSLTLDFILVPRYGMNGAVVSTIAIYSISLVINGGMALWIERRWRSRA